MINNNRCYRNTRSELDNMIDLLGITDSETDMPPVSEEERATIKLQLLYAQILARDIEEISQHSPSLSKARILEDLCNNWMENVKCLTEEILKDNNLHLNIIDVLKDFNHRY